MNRTPLDYGHSGSWCIKWKDILDYGSVMDNKKCLWMYFFWCFAVLTRYDIDDLSSQSFTHIHLQHTTQ